MEVHGGDKISYRFAELRSWPHMRSAMCIVSVRFGRKVTFITGEGGADEVVVSRNR